MDPLEFSVIAIPSQFQVASEVLEQFDVPCRLQKMVWENAWTELAEFGLYRFGPDVSMVGSTWLDSIVATGAVRPFTDHEVESLGGSSIFLSAAWQAVRLPWGNRVRTWAIPWVADVRVIYYWRDMLEQAGVDEEVAFQTPERVEETMARLRASGIEAPWGVWAYSDGHAMLQNASSWVWGTGGDYVSADGKQVLLNRPEALEGFISYLKLHRYMPPSIERVESAAPGALFIQRQAAVAMGVPGWLSWIYQASAVPDAPARRG